MDDDVTTEAAQEDESQLDPNAAAATTKVEDNSINSQEEAAPQNKSHPLRIIEILRQGDSNLSPVERLSDVSPVQAVESRMRRVVCSDPEAAKPYSSWEPSGETRKKLMVW